MSIQRDSELFKSFVNNYWQYYKELENEFMQTRRFVEFCPGNDKTYSIEFLKLYQAVCSEIDVIGKAMAKVANSNFKPEDKMNNIQKWWFEIQDEFFLADCPFTLMNPTARPQRFSISEYSCCVVEGMEFQPWRDYRIEQYHDKNNRLGYRLTTGSSTPKWWSDYNKVKHNRTSPIGDEPNAINYSKANLGNLCSALTALYILERAFMDTIGTEDDLSSFKDFSNLFVKPRRLTYKQTEEFVEQVWKDMDEEKSRERD